MPDSIALITGAQITTHPALQSLNIGSYSRIYGNFRPLLTVIS